MTLAEARAYVRQFVYSGVDDRAEQQREEIAQHMALTGTCVLHACWEVYGRARDMPCYCTPCMQTRGALPARFGLPRGQPAA